MLLLIFYCPTFNTIEHSKLNSCAVSFSFKLGRHFLSQITPKALLYFIHESPKLNPIVYFSLYFLDIFNYRTEIPKQCGLWCGIIFNFHLQAIVSVLLAKLIFPMQTTIKINLIKTLIITIGRYFNRDTGKAHYSYIKTLISSNFLRFNSPQKTLIQKILSSQPLHHPLCFWDQ